MQIFKQCYFSKQKREIIITTLDSLMQCRFFEQVCYDNLYGRIKTHIDKWCRINPTIKINKIKYVNKTAGKIMPLLEIYKYYVLSRED